MPENENTSTIFLFQCPFVSLLLLLCSCVSLLMPSAIAVSAQRHLPSRRPAFGTAHRMHIAYGLGPEAGSGVEHYLRDTTTDFHWDQYRRTAYNLTWRCMTPIFNIGPHTLWVGSQPAARDVQRLRSCDINQRLSALGRWGCQKAPGIRDMASFRMDDFLHDRSADAKQLQSVIRAMDSALRKGSLLVFCKQGCRRGPTLAGSYLMAKTRCAPGVAHRHLTCLRKPVERRVLGDLGWLQNYCQIFDADWQVAELPQVETSRACPQVPAPKQMPQRSQEGAARTALGQAPTEPAAGSAAASGAQVPDTPQVTPPAKDASTPAAGVKGSAEQVIDEASGAQDKQDDAPRPARSPPARPTRSRGRPKRGWRRGSSSVSSSSSRPSWGSSCSRDIPPAKDASTRAAGVKGSAEQVIDVASDTSQRSGPAGKASEASSSTGKPALHKRARFQEGVRLTEAQRSGSRSSRSRSSRTALGQDVENLQREVAELQAARLGEDLFGALSRCNADVSEARELLQRGGDVNYSDVVNYKDVGGMTPLHRAARIGNPEMVRRLMDLRADANAATFPSRAPGSATPLQCLAEADMSTMDMDDMRETLGLLLTGMSDTALGRQTTKGANVFHLAASRGNLDLFQSLVAKLRPRMSPTHMRRLLNATNIKGKTVRDLARYNAKIEGIVHDLGGELAYPKTPAEEFTHVPEWHHWNRRFHKAQIESAASSSSWSWSGSTWDGWKW